MSSQAYCVVGRSPRLAFWSVIKNHFIWGELYFGYVCALCALGFIPQQNDSFPKLAELIRYHILFGMLIFLIQEWRNNFVYVEL